MSQPDFLGAVDSTALPRADAIAALLRRRRGVQPPLAPPPEALDELAADEPAPVIPEEALRQPLAAKPPAAPTPRDAIEALYQRRTFDEAAPKRMTPEEEAADRRARFQFDPISFGMALTGDAAGGAARLDAQLQRISGGGDAYRKEMQAYLERKRAFEGGQDKLGLEAFDSESRRIAAERPARAPAEKPVDPLKEEATRAGIEKTKAETQKLLRPPVAKAKGDGKRDLAATQAIELGQYDVASKGLGDALADFEKSDMTGTLNRMAGSAMGGKVSPNSDAQAYLKRIKPAVQVVGKILEGGKLAAGDEVKYFNMFPLPGESLEVARQKVEALRGLLANQQTAERKSLGDAGFRVGAGSAPAGDKVTFTFPDGRSVQVSPAAAEVLKRKYPKAAP